MFIADGKIWCENCKKRFVAWAVNRNEQWQRLSAEPKCSNCGNEMTDHGYSDYIYQIKSGTVYRSDDLDTVEQYDSRSRAWREIAVDFDHIWGDSNDV